MFILSPLVQWNFVRRGGYPVATVFMEPGLGSTWAPSKDSLYERVSEYMDGPTEQVPPRFHIHSPTRVQKHPCSWGFALPPPGKAVDLKCLCVAHHLLSSPHDKRPTDPV